MEDGSEQQPPPVGLDVNSAQFMKLRQACEMGEPRACTIFGAGLSQDSSVKGKRVLKFLRMGCEKGDADGCYVLSKLQVLQRVPGGQDNAFRNSYTACRMGQVEACAQTGLMFIQGVGVKPDVGKGLTVLLNTCNQLEHGASCFAAARVISNLADNGMMVAKGDDEKSQELNTTEMLRSLLRKGCEYKHQDACKHLEEFEKSFPESPSGREGKGDKQD